MEKDLQSTYRAFFKSHNLKPCPEKPAFGFFHFTNHTFYPEAIPWLVVNGIYINESVLITAAEKPDLTYSEAKKKCFWNGWVLPSKEIRELVMKQREELNEVLQSVNFPILRNEEFWAQGDERFYYTEVGTPQIDPTTVRYEGLEKNFYRKTFRGFMLKASDSGYNFRF